MGGYRWDLTDTELALVIWRDGSCDLNSDTDLDDQATIIMAPRTWLRPRVYLEALTLRQLCTPLRPGRLNGFSSLSGLDQTLDISTQKNMRRRSEIKHIEEIAYFTTRSYNRLLPARCSLLIKT